MDDVDSTIEGWSDEQKKHAFSLLGKALRKHDGGAHTDSGPVTAPEPPKPPKV